MAPPEPSRSWFAPLLRSPRRLLAGGGALALLSISGTLLALRSHDARRAETERLQAALAQQQTRQQLALLQRRQDELQAQERRKQELAAGDTRGFQRAALEADLASQQRDLQMQRRTAFERQNAQIRQEQERQRKALQALLRDNVKGKLAQEDSEACLVAFSRYEATKSDPTTSPEKLGTELAAVRQICN